MAGIGRCDHPLERRTWAHSSRRQTVLNVPLGVRLIGRPAAGMVKVFGRRPLQVVREAWGRRTETAQARTRGAAATVYGDFDFCSVKVVAKPVQSSCKTG